MKSLLELRKKLNAKRPSFLHYDHQKRKEVGTRWRRPKGLHNKMRLGKWGKPATVNVGYRNPVAVRGLDQSGLTRVLVNTLSDLDGFDAKTQGVWLGSVGVRKRAVLLDACKKKNFKVLNFKSVDAEMSRIGDMLSARKKAKAERVKEKTAKQKVAAPKKEEKEAPKEESKEQAKAEKDKVLTKRE